MMNSTKNKLVVLISLLGAGLAGGAMAQEVHCFVDSTYSSETAGWAVTHFQTLSNAWSAVADAGEIDVAAGVYSAPTMVVDKTVAIRGSGSGQTFLQSSEEVTPLGWWQIAAGEVLTLEGCTLDVQTNTSFAVAIKAIGLLNMEYCSLALPVDCKAVETFQSLNLAYNYWGQVEPDFSSILTGAVTVEPWFTDSALTTLTFTGGAASLSENFVVEDGITLDVDEVTLSAGASLQVYNGTLRLAELNMDPASEVVVVDGSIILETSAGETEVAGTFTLYDAMGSMYIENDTEFSGDTLALVSHIGISDGVTVQVSGSLVLDGCTVNCVDQGGSYFWDVLPGADFKMARTEMEGCFSFLIKNDGTDIQSCTFDGTLIQVLAIASDTKIFHNVFLNSAQVFDAGLDTITNTDGWGNVGALSNAWNQLALEWTTNGLPNGRTLDAEGLFVQPGDSIDARVDLSSLSMPVSGCELLLGYNAGYLTNGILALEMPWEFDIYEDWSLQSGDPLFGQLDAGIGLGLTAPQEGLSSNGSVATVSFETTGKEGETLFYFRPQLDEPWHTRLASDTNGMSGTFLEPFSLNSQLLVVDGTKPEILSFSAFQDQGVAPVDVFAATNVTLEGTVLISLEASDQLSGLIDEPILMLTHQISAAELTPVLIASSNTASSTIYSWAVIMDGATETGVYDVSSIAQDRSGNMAVSAATLELVAPSATVELELQVPLSGSLNRQVTYSALSASMDELIQWQQNEEFINGSVVTELTSLPPDTAFIRVKAEKTLSRVQPVVFNASMHSLVNFTGTSNLLGGDLNEDNKVNVLDYFMVSSFWNTATDTADVDGDGQVNTIDYSVISFNWLLLGE